MTFRSVQMSSYQIVIPKQGAYSFLNTMGYQNVLHFNDLGDPVNRQFTHVIRRCDQSLQKIQLISAALKKNGMQFQEFPERQETLVPRLAESWRTECKQLNIQESKLIDIYQEKVADQYRRFDDLSSRLDKIQQSKNQILQKIACIQTLSEFFGNSNLKVQNQEYYIKNISQIQQIQGVSFFVGVIDNDAQWKISKTIYRISRGYACTRTLESFKFVGLQNFPKKVLLVIYPSTSSQILQRRLRKVLESFCQNFYSLNEFQLSANQTLDGLVKQYNQVTHLLQIAKKQYAAFLGSVKKTSNIETWRLFFWKQRALYECLDKFDRKQQYFIANAFIPTKQVKTVSLTLNKVVPQATIHETSAEKPPTAFDTNDYTNVPQQITDTYGVPRYQQVNPSIFATVTFPFFYGVMFGDVFHGLLILALGLFAVFNHNKFQKGALQILKQFRYMLTMMGFFAVYCGLIYNDFAGFSYNIFGSCYDVAPVAQVVLGQGQEQRQVSIPPHPDCVYYFGVDPAWGISTNSLTFVNSLKMKVSVIIAIVHMTLGILCKAANSLYFRKKLDFIFEFIPQFIFFVLLFGYMDFLIVFKWVTSWTGRLAWAPSIITTMMNIGLKLGKTSTIPDGGSNMWGQTGNTSQDMIQIIILLVAVLCIPTMLIPKPCIQIAHHNKQRSKNQKFNPLGTNQQQNLIHQSQLALQQKLNPSSQKQIQKQHQNLEQSSSQIIVHQLIETIQFVLGTISNTASYLRLWALSLAHGQLSKVFFQQTAGRFFGDPSGGMEIIGLFIGAWLVMWITFGIIICMDTMECFLHALRLHWVEFQNKFYKGDGYRYLPLSYKQIIKAHKNA